mmetsp:Transcript_10394/g.31151  ORF Transcript_10394/g.31151 Transcript_10394/m.31151 type:complete len:297 (+) Transcript_10394:584-1474(+)
MAQGKLAVRAIEVGEPRLEDLALAVEAGAAEAELSGAVILPGVEEVVQRHGGDAHVVAELEVPLAVKADVAPELRPPLVEVAEGGLARDNLEDAAVGDNPRRRDVRQVGLRQRRIVNEGEVGQGLIRLSLELHALAVQAHDVQGRRRAEDEAVVVDISGFRVCAVVRREGARGLGPGAVQREVAESLERGRVNLNGRPALAEREEPRLAAALALAKKQRRSVRRISGKAAEILPPFALAPLGPRASEPEARALLRRRAAGFRVRRVAPLLRLEAIRLHIFESEASALAGAVEAHAR